MLSTAVRFFVASFWHLVDSIQSKPFRLSFRRLISTIFAFYRLVLAGPESRSQGHDCVHTDPSNSGETKSVLSFSLALLAERNELTSLYVPDPRYKVIDVFTVTFLPFLPFLPCLPCSPCLPYLHAAQLPTV